jgi:hypothetical protein
LLSSLDTFLVVSILESAVEVGPKRKREVLHHHQQASRKNLVPTARTTHTQLD